MPIINTNNIVVESKNISISILKLDYFIKQSYKPSAQSFKHYQETGKRPIVSQRDYIYIYIVE